MENMVTLQQKSYVFRLLPKNISQEDIENAILNGEIIEEYESDYPYPSCLVYGISLNNNIIHIVCGVNNDELWIITAYYPDKEKWDNSLKIRKEVYYGNGSLGYI